MECLICGNINVDICKINNEFYECPNCKTQTRIKSEIFQEQYFRDEYFNDLNNIQRVLNEDKGHYENLFKILSQEYNYITTINELYSNKITNAYCFGGGYPKFEINLPFLNNIFVYDLIGDLYQKNFSLFLDIYSTPKNINFIKYDLDKFESFNIDAPSLLTFVHILEHFDIKITKQIFNHINDNIISGSYILIYQPNIDTATSKEWLHYHPQHMTFLPLNTFLIFLKSFSRFQIMYSKSYHQDMMIIVKVK